MTTPSAPWIRLIPTCESDSKSGRRQAQRPQLRRDRADRSLLLKLPQDRLEADASTRPWGPGKRYAEYLTCRQKGPLRYLQSWIDQLRWQRLKPLEKLAGMLLKHLEGILNYCKTKVRLGVVEAVNGNIKALLRRGRGYRDLDYLLLKAQRLAATKTEFVAFQKAA
jgi:transposase